MNFNDAADIVGELISPLNYTPCRAHSNKVRFCCWEIAQDRFAAHISMIHEAGDFNAEFSPDFASRAPAITLTWASAPKRYVVTS